MWLKGLAAAAALMWAGSAQAAISFDIGPGWGAEVAFGYGGPAFNWTDQSLDGPDATYRFAGYYTLYGPKYPDPWCTSDPACYVEIAASLLGMDYTAGSATALKRSVGGSYSGGPGKLWFYNTNGSTVKITFADLNGSVRRLDLPEPTTWAMILIGFGAIGAAMRRQPSRQIPSQVR